jgi:hypothetical protein
MNHFTHPNTPYGTVTENEEQAEEFARFVVDGGMLDDDECPPGKLLDEDFQAGEDEWVDIDSVDVLDEEV